jgi:type III restriction/modification enzyme, methylase subunit
MTFYERKLRMIDGKLTPGVKMSNIWTDVSYDGISPEGGVQLRGGKKPERLIHRILQLATNENDLVVDFFLGSGTTAAVAHKMGRKYIGIEQMDYIKHITTQRLINVIDGGTTGISKKQGWEGGGAFTYAELAEGHDKTGETSGGSA